jgi:hypothetical protein
MPAVSKGSCADFADIFLVALIVDPFVKQVRVRTSPARHHVSNNPRQAFTAQVILRSSDRNDASRVVDEFRGAGFDTGDLVANNFSISGPREVFERYFKLADASDGSRGTAAAPQPLTLRVDLLPEHVRPLVRDIVTSHIDFGPTNW